MTEYTTVSLPKMLADDVKELIEEVEYWPGFSSFVREATLEKLRAEQARLNIKTEEEEMVFVADYDLSKVQATLKWGLYCELDWSELEDVEKVLESLLRDVNSQKEATT